MKNQRRRKALFLYFELAAYFTACLKQLAADCDVEIHLVRYPVSGVAPFRFDIDRDVTLYERNSMDRKSLIALCDKLEPDFVFICGWADRDYLAVARHLKKRIPVVMSLDNPWRGTLKQYLASITGPLLLPGIFTHCWVPGEPNARYARKLGFKAERLLAGLYSADTDLFSSFERTARPLKEKKFPHRFLFVGRLTALKGIRELLAAFVSLREEERGDWELWCIGKGELEHEFPVHPAIRKIGFVQPEDMSPYIRDCGVFILPTHYEHWGVVVHEFATAGFPLICSSTTSAASAFLRDGYNGFITQPGDTASIKEAMLKIIRLNDGGLMEMGRNSTELAAQISPRTWSATVQQLMNTTGVI